MSGNAQEALVSALLGPDPLQVGLEPREAALLAYADILTRTPAAVTEAEITALRDAGLDDRAIHDACAIVAYFAFVNRVADGLGVELESRP